MDYYVYIYFDTKYPTSITIDGKEFLFLPFYVGKGKDTRFKDHMKIYNKYNTPFYAKLKKMISSDNYPKIEIIKYFDTEDAAYLYEQKIIKEIGSDYINEIKDGSLKNMILDSNNPPMHRGKSYLEIYGNEERAEYERKRRHEKQLEIGGFFKGKHHSEESKRKISRKTKGANNPMYGRKQSDYTKNLISEKAKQRTGRNNKNGKFYKLISPENNEYIVYGSELTDFCVKNNLSKSTIQKTLNTKKRVSHGKTKGWILYYDMESTLD